MDFIFRIIRTWILKWQGYLPLLQKRQDDEEIFYQRLLEGNYVEALRLAKQNSALDIELVYKFICHFDPGFYSELRQKSIFEMAIDYAHDSDVNAIITLFNCNPERLAEHHLAILSNFAETTPPMQYRDLLPSCVDQNDQWQSQYVQQGPDWSDRTSQTFEDELEYVEEFYRLHPHLVDYRGPITKSLISRWYIERAYEIESRTMLVSNALQLLTIGKSLRVPGLKAVREEFEEFYKIIYECCSDDNIDISLSQFKLMDHSDRLLLIAGNSAHQCKERFRFNIIPYIQRREAELGTVGKIKLMRDFFIKLAQKDQQLCRSFHKAWVDSIEDDYIIAKWTHEFKSLVDEITDEIGRIEEEKQVRSVSKVAQSTYDLGDFDNCYEACQVIMSKEYSKCWKLCAQLGLNPKFENTRARIKLLSFALAYCDDEGNYMVKLLTDIINLRKPQSFYLYQSQE